MTTRRISEIKPRDYPAAIEIRVIRKWRPHTQKREVCYLFVDIHGDAIEAVADANEEVYLDSVINIHSCYTITKYTAYASRSYMPVVPHHASLRIGRRTIFSPVPGRHIPNYYYNFATYDILESRLPRGSPLTDYIGRVESVTPVLYKAGRNLRKITLQDVRENVLELTLWEEMAFQFDRDGAIDQILAITSASVSKYDGALQLSATNASTTTINPQIPDLPVLIERFKKIEKRTLVHSRVLQSLPENKVTIAELLTKNMQDDMRTKFTCLATITEIHAYRTWYYVSCSECAKSVLQEEDESGTYVWTCDIHDRIREPCYRYCVNATITDDTSSAEVVIYNEAMNDILGMTCFDLVVTQAHTEKTTLPDAIKDIRGKPTFMELQLREDTIAVTKVFHTSLPLTMPSTDLSHPDTPSAKTQKRPRQRSPETPPAAKMTRH